MNKTHVVLVAGAVLLAFASPSHATLKLQTAAKKAGFPATNCLYCHNEKMPAKGKVTQNDRGTYLVQQKDKRKPNEIDVAWLKDFCVTK